MRTWCQCSVLRKTAGARITSILEQNILQPGFSSEPIQTQYPSINSFRSLDSGKLSKNPMPAPPWLSFTSVSRRVLPANEPVRHHEAHPFHHFGGARDRDMPSEEDIFLELPVFLPVKEELGCLKPLGASFEIGF